MTGYVLMAATTAEQRDRLAALAHEIWHEHYPSIIGAAQVEYMLAAGYNPDTLAAQQRAGTRFTLAVDDEDRAVGFAAVSPDTIAARTAWLDKLYVRADCRGKGIGRALLERVRAQALEMNARVLRLRVNRDNAGAVAAYQRAGFAIEASDVKDIGGGFVMDDYIMAADLGADHCRGVESTR